MYNLSEHTYKRVKIVLWLILFANVLVSAFKIGIGISCTSQSVLADGIHSFSDGSSNIVGLVGIKLASKPTDRKHPYGHMKFEIMASLFIGVMLVFMSMQIISRVITSFNDSSRLEFNAVKGVLMLVTICINIVVAVAEYRCGKKLKSTILITDSLHTRGDIMISGVVLIGLIGIKAGIPVWIDSLMSIGVAIVVLISAWQIIKNCIDVLVDSAVVDCNEIKELLFTIPGVYDIHNIRSRGGISQVFIDLHVIVDSEENVIYGHRISHIMEEVLKQHFGSNTEVNIHVEPDDGMHKILNNINRVLDE